MREKDDWGPEDYEDSVSGEDSREVESDWADDTFDFKDFDEGGSSDWSIPISYSISRFERPKKPASQIPSGPKKETRENVLRWMREDAELRKKLTKLKPKPTPPPPFKSETQELIEQSKRLQASSKRHQSTTHETWMRGGSGHVKKIRRSGRFDGAFENRPGPKPLTPHDVPIMDRPAASLKTGPERPVSPPRKPIASMAPQEPKISPAMEEAIARDEAERAQALQRDQERQAPKAPEVAPSIAEIIAKEQAERDEERRSEEAESRRKLRAEMNEMFMGGLMLGLFLGALGALVAVAIL